MSPRALIDSNVVIAAVVEAHEHHAPSSALFAAHANLAVAAHSYAEAYCTLTRKGERAPFAFSAGDAWAALESVRAVTGLVGLTPAQAFDAVRDYARAGGVGARLYDKLIGEVAAINGIARIVTWNAKHMQGLFPALEVVTPAALQAP